MEFEVYVASHNGEVLYVGEGKRKRSDHVLSGVSNIYHLNKLHFLGEKVDLVVYPFTTKEKAVEREAQLIDELKPTLNTRGTDREKQIKKLRKDMKNFDAVYGELLESNVSYCTIKAAIRNIFSDGRCTLKPVDLKIAGVIPPRKLSFKSTKDRLVNNPTSKLHWFMSKFEKVDGVGNYEITISEELLEEGASSTNYKTHS